MFACFVNMVIKPSNIFLAAKSKNNFIAIYQFKFHEHDHACSSMQIKQFSLNYWMNLNWEA